MVEEEKDTQQITARQKRLNIINQLEGMLQSKVLVYITGDRKGLETRIAGDIFPMFHQHLMRMGRQKRIDLFLYSTGGLTISGYALVNLIREFCDEFNVIIPFKALSTATLISMGANKIIMSPMGQLSPIDPSVNHPLGPQFNLPGQQVQIAPVNVEDVNAFIQLALKEAGLKNEDAMEKVFELLAVKVHPLVLGAVQRSREQIAFLASNLMKCHLNDAAIIENAVGVLTRERFSHDYIISRRDAKEILKLNIMEPEKALESLIAELLNAYTKLHELNIPYNPEMYLSASDSGIFDFNRGIIESNDLTHVYRTRKELKRAQIMQQMQPGGVPLPVTAYQERIMQEGWIEDNTI
ncbi:Serine dehydrogenase proteinase [uncultured archaeon]|nr:Serine dehydrogenase proteinase [uncultured archaeon]